MQRDHVVIVVVRKVRMHAVARLRRFPVPDAIHKNQVVARRVEHLARIEEFVGKIWRKKLAPASTRAVQDQHCVRRPPLSVGRRLAERRVVQPDLDHRLTGLEFEVADDEVALRRRRIFCFPGVRLWVRWLPFRPNRRECCECRQHKPQHRNDAHDSIHRSPRPVNLAQRKLRDWRKL